MRTGSAGGGGGGSATASPASWSSPMITISPRAGLLLLAAVAVLLAVVARHNRSLEFTQTETMSLRLERQHCERELKRARKELKQTDEECKTQIADMQDANIELEATLEEAARAKVAALDDKMRLLEDGRECEERFISVVTELDALKDEDHERRRLVDTLERQLEAAREEAADLRMALLEGHFDFGTEEHHFDQ